MRLKIDFETKMIWILDDLNITDFNMIAFNHKFGDFTFAGILQEEFEDEELEEEPTQELSKFTSVANFYDKQEND